MSPSSRWVGALSRGVERHPLFWAAVIACFAVLAADGFRITGTLGCLVLMALLVASRKWRVLLACSLLGGWAGRLHFNDVERRESLVQRMGEGVGGPIEARLLGDVRSVGRGWGGLAEVEASSDRVWIRAAGEAPPPGSVVCGHGHYRPLDGPRNPGEFDRRAWLNRQGVFADFKADSCLAVTSGPPAWWSLGAGVRRQFRDAVTRGLDPLSREAAVIRAVVLGEHPDDDVLIEPFRRSGTLHVFAVSGLHVGMVGLLGWLLLRSLGMSRRAAVVPLVALMFGYAWLTGMKPPAVRAAWMAAIVLGAFWFRRRPDLVNALGLAALWMLLRDGDLLFRAGVQLSFGVVMAIGFFHRGLGRAFDWIRWVEPYLPRSLYNVRQERWLGFRRRLADMLTVSSSAWLGSAPLTAWHFGLLTPISIVASVLLFPVVFPMLALALSSAILSPLPVVAEKLNGANAVLAKAALSIARAGASVPGGNYSVPRGRPGDEFAIVFDLRSDGAVCWKGESASVLIDGGSRRSFERVVMPSLRRLALRPESVVVTHPDGGHAGGMIEALDAFPVRRALLPVLRAKSSNYRALTSAFDSRDVEVIRGRSGRPYPLEDAASLEVLWEPDAWNWNEVADERVMPLRLDWRGWRILFMSDAGWALERALLEEGIDLGADVIVAGRHLHDASLGSDFLDATGARVIIASHSGFPAVQRIPEAWRRSCESRGVRVFHQGESGAVTMVIDDGALVLRGFVDGKEVRLSK